MNRGMASQRFDLLVSDPIPVFRWMRDHCASAIVRKMAYYTIAGWHMKIVLDDASAISAFETRWAEELASPGKRVTPRSSEEVLAELSEFDSILPDAGQG
jgi:hypothetical protein